MSLLGITEFIHKYHIFLHSNYFSSMYVCLDSNILFKAISHILSQNYFFVKNPKYTTFLNLTLKLITLWELKEHLNPNIMGWSVSLKRKFNNENSIFYFIKVLFFVLKSRDDTIPWNWLFLKCKQWNLIRCKKFCILRYYMLQSYGLILHQKARQKKSPRKFPRMAEVFLCGNKIFKDYVYKDSCFNTLRVSLLWHNLYSVCWSLFSVLQKEYRLHGSVKRFKK